MQDDVMAPTPIATPPTKPYVGLRPYERSEYQLFFGRDRDATFLVNKILSAKMTLLYAQSGYGKSSLLRALVAPQLEREHCTVLYYDSWGGGNFLDSLKNTLADIAVELGIPNPRGGAPTLTELVRLIASVDRRTFVLILDQFEEFLVPHSQSPRSEERRVGKECS
jgi:hypothetical protein